MAGVGIDDYGASWIKYMPGIRRTLNNTTNARQIAKAKEKKWQGESLDFSVHVARNVGVGNIEDGGKLPPAGKQSYVFAKIYRKFLTGSVQATDGILKNAATTEGASISVTESELDGLLEGMRKYENYCFTRDGTGIMTTIGATASGATFTVRDARALWDGKSFEIRDATTPTTIHDSFEVSKVARAQTAAGEATVTPSATLAASGQATGDYVVWGTGDDSAYSRAITGLDKLIDDTATTFQNVNVTTYPRYSSTVLANGATGLFSAGTARAMTPTLFRQALMGIKQESGENAPNGMTCLTNTWQSTVLEELYEGEVRLRPDDTTMGIVTTTFQTTVGKVNIVPDPDSPHGRFYLIAPEELLFAVQAPLDWRRDGPGAPIFKRNDQNAVYTATALECCELAILQRNKCGKIVDINEVRTSAY